MKCPNCDYEFVLKIDSKQDYDRDDCLVGSPKQIKWAKGIRKFLISQCRSKEEISKIKSIPSAKFFIEFKDYTPSDFILAWDSLEASRNSRERDLPETAERDFKSPFTPPEETKIAIAEEVESFVDDFVDEDIPF